MRLAIALACVGIGVIVIALRSHAAETPKAEREVDLVVDAGLLNGPEVTLHLSTSNLGLDTWKVVSVDSSCGCLQATPKTSTVAPNESLSIEARVSTDGRLGKQSYFVTAHLDHREICWRIDGFVPFPGHVDSKRLEVLLPMGEESFVASTWVYHAPQVAVAADVVSTAGSGDCWSVSVHEAIVVSESVAKSKLIVTANMNGRDELTLDVSVRTGDRKTDDRVVVEARRTVGCVVSPVVVLADSSRDGALALTTVCRDGVAVTDVVFGGDTGGSFTGECKGGLVVVRWKRMDVARVPRVFDVGLVLSDQQLVMVPAVAF